MPRYDLLCEKCQKVFDVQVPLDKYDEKVKCPHCGEDLKRQLSPVPFRIN
jgi:putative FmdB family regulatory protein